MDTCEGCGADSWTWLFNHHRCDYCGGRRYVFWVPVPNPDQPPIDPRPYATNYILPGVDRLKSQFTPFPHRLTRARLLV